MAAASQLENTDFYRRPLYVYDLPGDILSSLSYKESPSGNVDVNLQSQPSKPEPAADSENGTSLSTSCSLCQAKFASVAEQREHVRSDLHRYNIKMKMKGLDVMDEATFDKAVGDLDESISGSESESSEDDDTDAKPGDNTLAALLRKQAKLSESQRGKANNLSSKPKRGPGNPPIYWMTTPKAPDNTVLGVYRALLTNHEQEEAQLHLIEILRNKQLKPQPAKTNDKAANGHGPAKSPHIFLCMVGGGHFAAMIVALAPEVTKKGGIDERRARVIAHKTFHRYTTRRKQGGAQSSKDNSKGNIHSAGSSLRRYNEVALENDIRNLLSEWKSMIDTSELLFIRATGTTNRRTLFGPYDGQILRNNDPRIRGFPFSTRRATQSELMRCFTELTRLKVSTVNEVIPKDPQTQTPSTTKSTGPSKPSPPSLTPDQEALSLHTNQITALIRRSKVPALLTYLTNNSLSPSITFYPPNHHTPTPLHLASSSNSPALVLSLLTKPIPPNHGTADPTIPNSSGTPPYDLASNLSTRLAFRVARHQLGEEAWNWSLTHIPPGLSQPEADALLSDTKNTEKQTEAQRRKAELERLEKEADERKIQSTERKSGKGKVLGEQQKTAQDIREEETRGMTPEMKMRLERERRARAAEERMKKLQNGSGK
ncbi:putative c2h2 finger and ankyrin domain [Phaeomoniella chlamydospora]|uniref:Putative c2h2 finger and ankyrin domain n=1 Tax=Phaeomoniella chlamydospora TaxID=158046 RepID=A0A0G2EJW9_PHACM|nr:putative c2h2 finger and ankyrin domain [Phaeomoniella chlamydospora]